MKAPSGLYPGEHSWWSVKDRDIRYKATGEYRPPRKGEFYLSGAIISAYRAPQDLGPNASYWIAVPGHVTTETKQTWIPLADSQPHVCSRLDDDGRPVQPERATCGRCGRSWCDWCDPVAVSALCHYCHGRGHSTAPLPKEPS